MPEPASGTAVAPESSARCSVVEIRRTRRVQLLSWQVAGRSSRTLPNWFLTKVDEMADLILLDETFPGGSPIASGKHIEWDGLFIRVKPAGDHLHAGSG